MRSSSSGQPVSWNTKARESTFQLYQTVKQRGPFARSDYTELEADLAEYRRIASEYGGFELVGARAFAVGCGQRPYRLMYLLAAGVDVYGTDLDVVTLGFRPSDMLTSLRENGAERALKTTVRYVTSDVFENRRLKRFLSTISGAAFEWPTDRIAKGTAGDPAVWPDGPVDFVYSEDVFEHIPASELPEICALIASRLSAKGLAMIRPNVFTGIQGGHSIDYYDLDPSRHRRCPPWDHLRGYQYPANTYLNEMTRADYRSLFSEHFIVLDEQVKHADKGRSFMTASLRAELSEYSDDELFSNQVRWVMKPRL